MIFYKYQGCGNDFIILDGRNSAISLSEKAVKQACDRRFGIGADGLMILESSDTHDFSMQYYNSDGRKSSFCGNGGRSIVRFAKDLHIISDTARFLFDSDSYMATIKEPLISLQMQPVRTIQNMNEDWVLDTGSPHYVHFAEDIERIELLPYARSIRYSSQFPEGINVNIVERKSDNTLAMRTYERGVEDETYSCGTGVVAAALAYHHQSKSNQSHFYIQTKGGEFEVGFQYQDGFYSHILLIGRAEFVYQGEYRF